MASDKKCKQCGTSNPPTAKFCRNCGNKFQQYTAASSSGSSTSSSKSSSSSSSSDSSSSSGWAWLSTPAVGYALYKLIQLIFS